MVEHAAITLPAAVRATYLGAFAAKDVTDFAIRDQGGQLQLDIKGENLEPLFASGTGLFFTIASEMQIRFDSANAGVLLVGDASYPFTRVQK